MNLIPKRGDTTGTFFQVSIFLTGPEVLGAADQQQCRMCPSLILGPRGSVRRLHANESTPSQDVREAGQV